MPLPDESVRELTALTGVVLLHDDLHSTLDEICRLAVRALPAAHGASLTTFADKGPDAVAASDDWSRALDEMQYDEHEGPCLDAARSGLVLRVRDTAEDLRWPSYMPRALEHGCRSMVSLPMTVESKTIGALNVYSRASDRFGPEEVSIGQIIAGHATLASQVSGALHRHRDLAEQLRAAMGSRAAIEQAKGVVMAAEGCDPDTAFHLLVQQSQRENRKLRDVAQEIVDRVSGRRAPS